MKSPDKKYHTLSFLTILSGILLTFFLPEEIFCAEKKEQMNQYPVIVEAWQKGILFSETAALPESSPVLEEKLLKKYSSLYKSLKDPALRKVLAFELRQSHSKSSFRMLTELLNKEEDFFCKSALLDSMRHLAEKGYGDKDFAEKSLLYLDLKNTESKKNAAFLYFHLSALPAPEKVFSKLKGDGEEYLMRQFFPILIRYKNDACKKMAEDWRNETDPARKAVGSGLSLLYCDGKEVKEELLKAALPSNPYLVRLYLAMGAAYKKDLPPIFFDHLFKDGDNGLMLAYLKSVRGNTIQKGCDEKIIRKLLSSEKQSISLQLAALEALEKAGERASTDICVDMLTAKEPVLRRAAVQALVKMVPEYAVRKKIIESAVKYPPARLEIARFFEIVRDEKFDDTIILFLENTGKNLDAKLREIELEKSCIKILTKGKEAKVISSIIRKSSSPVVSVRECVAECLGSFPGRKSLGTLKKLLRDKEPAVVKAALSSITRLIMQGKADKKIAATVLGKELIFQTGNLKFEFAEARAGAIRAAALLFLTEKCRKNLERLVEKECIVQPMTPPSLDADHVRVSCLLALYEAGKNGSKICKKSFERLLSAQIDKAGKDEYASEAWKEYLRQINLMQQNKKIIPGKTKPGEAVYSIRVL